MTIDQLLCLLGKTFQHPHVTSPPIDLVYPASFAYQRKDRTRQGDYFHSSNIFLLYHFRNPTRRYTPTNPSTSPAGHRHPALGLLLRMFRIGERREDFIGWRVIDYGSSTGCGDVRREIPRVDCMLDGGSDRDDDDNCDDDNCDDGKHGYQWEQEREVAGWISGVERIATGVRVCGGCLFDEWVDGQELSDGGVVVAGAKVGEAGFGVGVLSRVVLRSFSGRRTGRSPLCNG